MSNSPILYKKSLESSTLTPTSPKSSHSRSCHTPHCTPEAHGRPHSRRRRRASRKRSVRKSATPPKFRKRTRASSYSPSSTEEYSDEDDFPSYRSDWKKKSPISTRELKNRIADIQNIIEEAQLKLKVLLSD